MLLWLGLLSHKSNNFMENDRLHHFHVFCHVLLLCCPFHQSSTDQCSVSVFDFVFDFTTLTDLTSLISSCVTCWLARGHDWQLLLIHDSLMVWGGRALWADQVSCLLTVSALISYFYCSCCLIRFLILLIASCHQQCPSPLCAFSTYECKHSIIPNWMIKTVFIKGQSHLQAC